MSERLQLGSFLKDQLRGTVSRGPEIPRNNVQDEFLRQSIDRRRSLREQISIFLNHYDNPAMREEALRALFTLKDRLVSSQANAQGAYSQLEGLANTPAFEDSSSPAAQFLKNATESLQTELNELKAVSDIFQSQRFDSQNGRPPVIVADVLDRLRKIMAVPVDQNTPPSQIPEPSLLDMEERQRQMLAEEQARNEAKARQREESEKKEAEAKNAHEKDGFHKPRTPMEEVMEEKGVDLHGIWHEAFSNNRTEEESYEYFHDKTFRVFLSIMFSENEGNLILTTLDFPNLAALKIQPKPGAHAASIAELLAESSRGTREMTIVERQVLKKIYDRKQSEIDALGTTFSRDENYSKKKFFGNSEKLRELFPDSGENSTFYDKWYFEALFGMGKMFHLDKETQEWIEDKEAFGDQIFRAIRELLLIGRAQEITEEKYNEMVRRGRRKPFKIDDNGKTRYFHYNSKVKTSKGPKKLRTHQRVNPETGRWENFPVYVTSRNSAKQILPYSERIPGSSPQKFNNFQEMYKRIGVNESAESKTPLWSSMLAVKFANGSLESAYQDPASTKYKDDGLADPTTSPLNNTEVSDDYIGKPEAVSYASRLMSPWLFVLKYLSERNVTSDSSILDASKFSQDVGSDVNPALFLLRGAWPFFDYYGYGGKTFSKHIMESSKPTDVKWSKLPDQASSNYGGMLSHAIPLLDEMMSTKIDLSKLAAFNLERQTFESIDIATNKKIIKLLRLLFEYMAKAHSGSGEVLGLGQVRTPEEVETTYKDENPTGEYFGWEIHIVDDAGNIKGVSATNSRITEIFPILPEQLLTWVRGRWKGASVQTLKPQPEYRYKSTDSKTGEPKIVTGKKETMVNSRFVIRIPERDLKEKDRKSLSPKDPSKSEYQYDVNNLLSIDQLLLKELCLRLLSTLTFLGDSLYHLQEKDKLLFMVMLGDQESVENYSTEYTKGSLVQFINRIKAEIFKKGGDLAQRLRQNAPALRGLLALVPDEEFILKEVPGLLQRHIYEWNDKEIIFERLGEPYTFLDVMKSLQGDPKKK